MSKKLTSGMGIWFQQEIIDLLRAVDFASASVTSLVPTHEAKLYQLGFEAAIEAVAHGFGVEFVRQQPHVRDLVD